MTESERAQLRLVAEIADHGEDLATFHALVTPSVVLELLEDASYGRGVDDVALIARNGLAESNRRLRIAQRTIEDLKSRIAELERKS
jgi:hypothetical protein